MDKFDTPKNTKLARISSLKFILKKPRLSQYSMDATNKGSKFKSDCVKSKNSYTLPIDVINLKLRLINCVYFLDTRYSFGKREISNN